MNAILGGVCSDETIAIAPIAENAKKILITSGSSATLISHLGDYVFRNYAINAAQAEIMANFVKFSLARRAEISSNNEDMTKIALIVQDTAYARDLADGFLAFFEGSESPNISSYNVYDSSVIDFSHIVSKVKDSGASLVVVLPQTSDKGLMIFNELRKQQVLAIMVSSEVLAQPEFVRENSDVLERVVVINRPPLSDNPRVVEFLKNIVSATEKKLSGLT